MREVVLDTETTGQDPRSGHRVVEIGCVELVNHVPSGATFNSYVDPQRDMPAEAFAVHGLSQDFLARHAVFEAVADDLVDFLAEAPLVIHNAAFDLGFLNAELGRLGRPPLPRDQAIDTVALARRKYPGAQVSLDALCRRFEIDLSARDLHGALLDAQLLAQVYLELIGGRQPGLELAATAAAAATSSTRLPRAPRPHAPSEAEAAAHAELVARLNDPVWQT